jgi:TonB family protein
MTSNGAKTVIGSFKVCINETGELTAVETLWSTGYRPYDEEILNAIDVWRFEPYRVLERAVSVCTAVTFMFRPARKEPETPRERALREWDEEQARNAR